MRPHREGALEAAREAYEALLGQDPEDPDLLGLLGMVAYSQGRQWEAEQYLIRSLSPQAPPPIQIRNLNNLVVMMVASGRQREACELVAHWLPDRPEGLVAEGPARDAVVSLARIVARADSPEGAPDRAIELLSRALPDAGFEAETAELLGRLHLAAGRPRAAFAPLARARRLEPEEPGPLIALGTVLEMLGERARAAEVAREIGRCWPLWTEPERESQQLSMLVLNPLPERFGRWPRPLRELHFASDCPAEFANTLAGGIHLQ